MFSGSRPEGFRLSDYARLLALCRESGAKLCVDASGPMLRAALKARPWIVKPNLDELSELVGRRLSRVNEVLQAAVPLTKRCEHVLVSLGRNGALLVSRQGAWRARESSGRVSAVHTVGCGDALLAGFLSACARGEPLPEATRFAVACGSACVRSYRACLLSGSRSAAVPSGCPRRRTLMTPASRTFRQAICIAGRRGLQLTRRRSVSHSYIRSGQVRSATAS